MSIAKKRKPIAPPMPLADWFGSSQVRGASLSPLVVFHGTARDFKKFRVKPGRGFYFSSCAFVAGTFADAKARDQGGAVIIPAMLSMQNPLRVSANSGHWGAIKFEGQNSTLDYISQVARERGFDGVIAEDIQDLADMGVADDIGIATTYDVFTPEQIRFAIGEALTQA